MEPVDIITIDESNRLVVTYDEYSENPLERGWGVEMFELQFGRNGMAVWSTEDNPDPTVRAFNEFAERLGTHDLIERATQLYMKFAKDDRTLDFRTVYVGRDVYNYLILGVDQVSIDSFLPVFAAYMNGEVYTVTHEKREIWTSFNGNDTMETWEYVDSINGNYLTEKYTALDAAQDHFYLTTD